MENINDTPSLEAFKALPYSQQEALVVRTNLKFITDFMREHAVSKIVASYSGSGDEGNGIDLEILDTQGKHLGGYHAKPAWRMCWEGKRNQETLQELVEIFTDDLINCAGYEGYECDDGGGGTLTILADGTFNLNHYVNVVEVSTVESSYDHNDLLEDV